MRYRFFLFFLFFYFFANNIFSQGVENDLHHNIHYQSHNQNMWGPDSSYDIDVEHTFFNLNIDESWGFSQISQFLGQQFGVGANLGIFALLRSTFEAHGFATGSFSLDYPIQVTLDFPEHYSFNYGGPATIRSSYEVTEGWNLETSFPPVGVITLDLEYEFNPFANIIVCVFGCDTIHLIPPSVHVPHTLDTLFHINGETQYAIYPCYVGTQFQFCRDYQLPIDIDFTDLVGFSFVAHVDLPNVSTTDYVQEGTQCLIARGEDRYMDIQLDVIGFLYVMAGFIPAPEGPQIQQALDFLNDTLEYPFNTPIGDIIFRIEYSLLSVDFLIENTLHQDIYFCPTIWSTLSFPVSMPYTITDPNNSNSVVETGFSDSVRMAVGNDLTITYPCHDWDSMYVGVKYNIQPTIRNHTWDSMSFSFLIRALTARISIVTPFKTQIAPAVMPEFSLPFIENVSPISSASIRYDKYYLDTLTNSSLAKDIGPWTIGPLFSWDIALGYVPLTWFDRTWELMHFQEDLVFPGTYIKPYDKSEVNALLYTDGAFCYGQNEGYLYAEAQNGVPPYDYHWSNGISVNNTYSYQDSINVSVGYYIITITDSNNCESYDSLSISINPPLFLNLTSTDVNCHGYHTGRILTDISGGTQPYFFEWSNGAVTQNLNNAAAGDYTLTVTDFFHCSIIDSISIQQPESAITILATPTHIPCYGAALGSIDVSLSGATPPYSVVWSSGQTYQDLYNISAGTYTISVTDALGCLWSQPVTIIEPEVLVADMVGSQIPCNGLNNGSINVYVSGGTEPYTYQWFHDLNNHSNHLTNLVPGLYFVSVTDEHGCSDTASMLISEPNKLILDFVVKNVSCKGGHDGHIIVHASGGVPDYNITWSNGYYSDSIGNLPIGDYIITVVDRNTCTSIETITIVEPTNFLRSNFSDIHNVSCYGFNDASALVVPFGGTEPHTITWDSNAVQVGNAGQSMLANIFYNITVQDVNSCVYYDSIKFTQPPQLILSGTTSPVGCGTAAGTATVNISGGTPHYTYLWSNGEIVANAVDLPSGNNYLIVKDANNCLDTLNLFVDKKGKIFIKSSIVQNNLCYGDSIAIALASITNGIPPYNFRWSNGQVGDTAYRLSAGKYKIYAEDKYKCNDSIIINITQPDSVKLKFEITSPSCSYMYDGTIVAKPYGGTPDYQYLWSTGETTDKLSKVRDGIYFLSVTDKNNCEYAYTVQLVEAKYCITIYNTFSPNGDGVNDKWVIDNIEHFKLSNVWIYNRNGSLVYSSENYQNDWDGSYNGKPLPEGVYYYIIDLHDGRDPYSGHVNIIR